MYICTDCLELYEVQPQRQERHTLNGEHFSEWVADNCHCGGTVEKAVRCKVCGEYFAENALTNKVCDECCQIQMKEEQIADFIARYVPEKCSFEVNPILEHVFTSSEVNELLMRELNRMLHGLRMMPGHLEDALKNELKDDWAEFLAYKGEY